MTHAPRFTAPPSSPREKTREVAAPATGSPSGVDAGGLSGVLAQIDLYRFERTSSLLDRLERLAALRARALRRVTNARRPFASAFPLYRALDIEACRVRVALIRLSLGGNCDDRS